MRRAWLLFVIGFGCASSASSWAAPVVQFHATLTPERPGHRTTATFTVTIASPGSTLPPPLVGANFRYPAGLGLALSGLGIENCRRPSLEAHGPHGCPAESFIGNGSATAAMSFGPDLITEDAPVWLLRSGEQAGQITMYFLVAGETPVSAEPVLTGVLGSAPAPYGGQIAVTVPLVAGLPGGPPVSLVKLHFVVGPRGITYYERVHGQFVPYHPLGLSLPACPAGGYTFALELRFLDGSVGASRTRVPCPRQPSRVVRYHSS